MDPKSGGIHVEVYSGTTAIIFLQNTVDGGQPLAIFNSLDRSITSFGDCDIPNHYNRNELGSLISNTNLSNNYNKAEIDSNLATHSCASNSYTKNEVETLINVVDNEISTLSLKTYTKHEIDSTISLYSPTVQIYNDLLYGKGYMNQMLYTSNQIGILLH